MWGLCFVRNFCYLFHSLVYTHSKQFGWIHNCMNWSPIKLEVYHQLWLNLQVFSFHIIKWSAKPLLKAFHFLVFSQAYFYPKIWIAGTKSLCGGQVCTTVSIPYGQLYNEQIKVYAFWPWDNSFQKSSYHYSTIWLSLF